jgi:hypothetical protein
MLEELSGYSFGYPYQKQHLVYLVLHLFVQRVEKVSELVLEEHKFPLVFHRVKLTNSGTRKKLILD